MADAKLDMSLDDIIKKAGGNKKNAPAGTSQRARIQQKRRGGLAGRGRGAARGAGRSAGRGGAKIVGAKAGRAPISIAKSVGVGVRGRGVQKFVGRGRGAVRGGRGGLKRGGGPATPAARRFAGRGRGIPVGTARWTHDMYNQGALRPAGNQRQQGATLLISNLNYNVSDDDIKELFSSIGPLVSYGVNYDRSGRSEGTAQVVYRTKEHAMAAMKRYNNVALDNLKMVISLREPSNPNILTTLASGISVTSLGSGANAGRTNASTGRNAGFAGRGGGRFRGGRGGARGGRGRGGRASGGKTGPDAMKIDG